MCGIAGIIAPEGASGAVLKRMLAALEHRGPDEGGAACDGKFVEPARLEHVDARVSMGNRRLRVIDPLPRGRQPISNEDGTVHVVYNGELYNTAELRAELIGQGHVFTSETDTEVLVHLYEEYGEALVDRIVGMFAFAIYDMRGGKVLLGRDRLGIKPLYLARTPVGELIFSSEVRAILSSGKVERRLSAAGLAGYLRFGSVQEPETLVEGVTSLPAGHTMWIHLGENLRVEKPRRYWSLEKKAPTTVESIETALREAVVSHLVSDVPLGMFLSGGIDSGAIAAVAHAASKAPLHTLTVTFDERDYDEAVDAAATARLFSDSHHEVRVKSGDVVSEIASVIADLDQPSIDGPNTWFVARAARNSGLTVALSGLGGDEIFAGYSTFARARPLAAVAWLLTGVPKRLRNLLAEHVAGPDSRGDKMAAFLEQRGTNHPYFAQRSLYSHTMVERLAPGITDSPRRWEERADRAIQMSKDLGHVDQTSYLELAFYTQNTLLRDADQMSMAHALEVRVPMLDHRLVEAAFSYSDVGKMKSKQSKWLLVAAVPGSLPSVVASKPKATFTFPWQTWLRGPLKGKVETSLLSVPPSLAHLIDHQEVMRVWAAFLDGRTNWARPWALYVLFEWVRATDIQQGAA